MILSGFQEEHQLLDWYEQDSISALQYIEHHSIGMINRFKKWCQESGSSEDEESAKDFLDEYNGLFLDTVVSKNENSTTADTSMFHQWCENTEFLDELYSSKPVLHVTLWRYQNPCSTDKLKCAQDLNISAGDIEKWWPVVDFLNFEHGGNFQPVRLDEESISMAILHVCQLHI